MIPKKQATYRDIDLSFRKHPMTGDILAKNDTRAAMQSIRNLVYTSVGEFLMQPDIGGNVNTLLFQLNSPMVRYDLEKKIFETIQLYEPRVEIELVDVFSDEYEVHKIYCKLILYILNNPEPVEDVILLQRYR